jgi:hypothetical protein
MDLSDTKYRDEAIARALKILDSKKDTNQMDAESLEALRILGKFNAWKKIAANQNRIAQTHVNTQRDDDDDVHATFAEMGIDPKKIRR